MPAPIAVMDIEKMKRLIERMADFDCFQPWGTTCDKLIGGEIPCEACEAKEMIKGDLC